MNCVIQKSIKMNDMDRNTKYISFILLLLLFLIIILRVEIMLEVDSTN